MSRRTGTIRAWLGLMVLLMAGGVVHPAPAQELTWQPFEGALAIADSTEQPVFVDVYAPWCGWCRKMKREVYPSDGVRTCLDDQFVLTRLNRDDTETTHRYRGRRYSSLELAQQLQASAVPTVVVLDPSGAYLLHLSGFIEAEALQPVLAYVASGAYRNHSFEAFREEAFAGAEACGTEASASVE